MRSIALLIIMFALAFCETSSQTDWSYGPFAMIYPVQEWTDFFMRCDGSINFGSELYLAPLEHSVDNDFYGASSVYSADIDGDGDEDVLGAAKYDNEIAWWENSDTAPGIIWTKHSIDNSFDGSISVFSVDIDGDGDMDVLGAAKDANEIAWWENSDATPGIVWTKHCIDGYFDGAQSVTSVDIDGDGDMDVLGAAKDANEIAWWRNVDGFGATWSKQILDYNFYGANSVSFADIDGDGDVDILGAAKDANEIAWWENTTGTGTTWVQHTVDFCSDASSVFSTDIDGDGDADLLSAGGWMGNISWWENTEGTGLDWSQHIVDDFIGNPNAVFSIDMDDDGDADILGVGSGDIAWWENTDGAGSAWSEHCVDYCFTSGISVYAADIDGDGNTDILGTSWGYSLISWWDVGKTSPFGALESSILDTGYSCDWISFLSNSVQPSGTTIGFQFRSSDSYTSMGEWSDTVFTTSTSLDGILEDSTRYLQYKVILQASNQTLTPELHEVEFGYTFELGVEEGGSYSDSWVLQPLSNPGYGVLSFSVTVPEAGFVEVSLYDVSGRLVSEINHELSQGIHVLNFEELSKGLYFCNIRASDFSSTKSVILLD